MNMGKTPGHSDKDESLARRHEVSDANFRNLMITALGLLGLVVFGLVFSWVIYLFSIGHTGAPGEPTQTFVRIDPSQLPPGPNLQPDPHAVLVMLQHREDSILTSYAWVNKDSGIVRIPIDRAMALLAKRGLPVQESGRPVR